MTLYTEHPVSDADGRTVATEVSGNVFAALGFDEADAARACIRADLAGALAQHVQASGWTQAIAAQHLGTTQARISALVRGRVASLSLDALVTMAARAGLRVRLAPITARQRRKTAA